MTTMATLRYFDGNKPTEIIDTFMNVMMIANELMKNGVDLTWITDDEGKTRRYFKNQYGGIDWVVE